MYYVDPTEAVAVFPDERAAAEARRELSGNKLFNIVGPAPPSTKAAAQSRRRVVVEEGGGWQVGGARQRHRHADGLTVWIQSVRRRGDLAGDGPDGAEPRDSWEGPAAAQGGGSPRTDADGWEEH